MVFFCVVEVARVGLLDDLVPGRDREAVVLLAQLAGVDVEELVLGREIGEHPARDPSHVATLILRRAVFGILLRHLREVGPSVERLPDLSDLLQLIGECLEVASLRARRRVLDLRDVHLRCRRCDAAVLLPLRELVAQDVVLRVALDIRMREAGGEPSLHDLVLGGTAALLDLDDVIAEVGLRRIGDLPDRECLCRVLERLHELALPHPAQLTARRGAAWVLRIVLRELVPELLVVGVLTQLVAYRGRLRERGGFVERFIRRRAVERDQDVPAAELSEVLLVARLHGIGCDGDPVGPGLLVEDRVLLESVERAPVVGGLLLRDLRVALVPGRNPEFDVEPRELIGALVLPVAHRNDPAVELHRRLQVGLVVAVARGPTDESQDEEKHGREDDHDDRLLAAFPLPTRAALPTAETWKWDPAGHIWRPKLYGSYRATRRYTASVSSAARSHENAFALARVRARRPVRSCSSSR